MKTEKTFVILKPDAIQRSLIGEVIGRFEKVGLKCIAMKMLVPTAELARKHYTFDPEWVKKAGTKNIDDAIKRGITLEIHDPIEIGNQILSYLTKYLTSGPVAIMVWQGAHAVKIVRKLVGSTEPLSSDVGTIRGDFVLDSYEMSTKENRSIRNIIHASGTPEEARDEIGLWFQDSEIINYNHIQEAILYGQNLDGILG